MNDGLIFAGLCLLFLLGYVVGRRHKSESYARKQEEQTVQYLMRMDAKNRAYYELQDENAKLRNSLTMIAAGQVKHE